MKIKEKTCDHTFSLNIFWSNCKFWRGKFMKTQKHIRMMIIIKDHHSSSSFSIYISAFVHVTCKREFLNLFSFPLENLFFFLIYECIFWFIEFSYDRGFTSVLHYIYYITFYWNHKMYFHPLFGMHSRKSTCIIATVNLNSCAMCMSNARFKRLMKMPTSRFCLLYTIAFTFNYIIYDVYTYYVYYAYIRFK